MSCVCRCVLAVVALSCTLPCTRGQAPRRLDRIKDLMCVLILSGTQKEDLDVNMLNKLQRYNVNIGDMNNRELLQECTALSRDNEINKGVLSNSTTLKESLYEDNENQKLSNKTEDNSLSDKKKYSTNKYVVRYTDGRPDVNSVLTFWKHIKGPNDTQSLERRDHSLNRYEISDQKNKRNVQRALNSVENDNIQKLLTNFLLQSGNKTDVISTTEASFNMRNDFQNLFFKEAYDSYKNGRFMETNVPIPRADPSKEFELRYANIPQAPGTVNTTVTKESYKNNAPYKNMLTFYNTFKTFNLDMANNSVQDFIFKTEPVTEIKTVTTLSPVFPQNVIKEIVISVKDMVLRELRKEMAATTVSTSCPTFITSTYDKFETEKNTNGNHNIEETIMNKFMILFKEMKSLKHGDMISSPENKRISPIIDTQNFQQWPTNVGNNMKDLDQTTNKNEYKNPVPYAFTPQKHRFRLHNIPNSIHDSKVNRLITVQTNNMEIPPLGIPIDIPENPINENIVVTTPPLEYRQRNDKRDAKLESSIGIDDYATTTRDKHLKKQFMGAHYSDNNPKYQDVTSFVRNDRLNFNSNKENHHNRYKQYEHMPKAKPQRYHEQLENMDSYIDRLEPQEPTGRTDCCDDKYAYSKQMTECCDRKIAARQQMSINKVKKQSMYDAHYNNFIKSQQKVNDMLERILAEKAKDRMVQIT